MNTRFQFRSFAPGLIFFSILRVVFVGIIGSHLVGAAEPAPKRPNIVVLLADDYRWDAFGAAGNKVVLTPNLDRLASRGVRMANAFVTTSICYSARASLFLGQYERRHQIRDFSSAYTPDQWAETYPARLRAAGYWSGFIGQIVVGTADQLSREYDVWDGARNNAGFFDPADPTQTHSTARMGNQAVEFIAAVPQGHPFVLTVSFDAPHALDGRPREYPPDLRDENLYQAVTIPVPPLATPEAFDRLPIFIQNSEGRARWSRRFADPEMFQRVIKDYYRLLSGIDREVGRIVAALEAKGMIDNTVIVFLSDNGYQLGDRGLADKWFPYEQSIRIPLIFVDPRLSAPRKGVALDAQVLNIDIAPTLLELAGLPIATRTQGRSFASMTRTGVEPADWRHEFFYEYLNTVGGRGGRAGAARGQAGGATRGGGVGSIPSSEAVRTVDWKYIRWVQRDPEVEELFDLRSDPGELTNLATNPGYAETLNELRRHWAELAQQSR